VAGIVFGHLAWLVARLTFSATAFFIVMLVFGYVASPLGVLGIGASVLTGLAFAAPITAFSAGQKNDTAFSAINRFLITPLFLFSGTFFPIDQLPVLLRPVAWITPTFHGVALARGLSLGTIDPIGFVVHTGVLVLYITLGTVWALAAFRRVLSR
jgi:lipooligosaccharide transport system permease protein